jgi:hypothetical protein
MSRLDAVTPPMWIFGFTLLLVIITGGFVGSSPCERAVSDCEALAREAQPADATLREQYVAECSAQACTGGKRSPLLPISILILGFVLYRLWLRHGDPEHMKFFPDPGSFSDPVPAGAGTTPAAREATLEPEKPSVARQAPAAKEPPKEKETPKAKAPPKAIAPAKAKEPPKAKEPGKAKEAGKPKALKAPAKQTPDTARKAPAIAAAAADRELDAKQQTFCLQVLSADEAESREAMAGTLGRLTGAGDADLWKGAPLGDLGLLARSIAVAALIGPSSTKYRRALDGTSATIDDKSIGDLQELTKKALHEQCVQTLQRDLQALAGQGSYPRSVKAEAVGEIAAALQAEDALGGLSRCSKAGLVHLAAFLA